MAAVFTLNEVLLMAEQIERNGSQFYRAAARRNPPQAEVLLTLAKQENQHRLTFSGLRRQLAAAEKTSPTYDPNNEAALYLKAMADRRVFDVAKKPEDLLSGKEPLADILAVALGLEKESIAFYVGLKALVPPALGQNKIDAVIREEYRHIQFLMSLWDQQCSALSAP